MCESKVMCACVSVLVNLSESLRGSCAVWMFCSLSAACRHVSSLNQAPRVNV